jgi:hypothetical protein
VVVHRNSPSPTPRPNVDELRPPRPPPKLASRSEVARRNYPPGQPYPAWPPAPDPRTTSSTIPAATSKASAIARSRQDSRSRPRSPLRLRPRPDASPPRRPSCMNSRHSMQRLFASGQKRPNNL